MSVVDYRTANSQPTNGPSPEIWADCPVIDIIRDPSKGLHLFEDFDGGVIADAASQNRFSLVGSNPDMAGVSDELNGVVELEGSTGANEEAYLVSNILYQLQMESHKKFWLEARVKFEDADADCAFIFGLAEAELLAADCITDDSTGTSTIADYGFVGFFTDCDGTNMDNIDAVYSEDGDGGVLTNVDEDVVSIVAGATTYDDVYIRLGMRFDGIKTVTFYVDGVATGTTLDIDDFASGTANELDPTGILLGYKNLAGTQVFLAVDWIRFACEK